MSSLKEDWVLREVLRKQIVKAYPDNGAMYSSGRRLSHEEALSAIEGRYATISGLTYMGPEYTKPFDELRRRITLAHRNKKEIYICGERTTYEKVLKAVEEFESHCLYSAPEIIGENGVAIFLGSFCTDEEGGY